ncbi:hypothetical protein [Candidatus Cardinium hertigii]|uniref:hypothetical protein n=1 Tax=Candidatus Cardinium hertigii TaxID=247481 RepID=UPI003D7C43D1
MAKKYIAHQSIWLLIIIATYLTGGSCNSCNRKRNRTTTPTPKSTPKPIDKSDVTSSASSGYASDSDGSTSSGSSSYSNFSSGSASSSRSSSPDPEAPFVGITNIGNTCYMNGILQIIAALYEDKIQNHDGLKKLVDRINKKGKEVDKKHKPLERKEIEDCVNSLPENAQKMATLGNQEDPYEFISRLMEEIQFLDPIQCTESFVFTRSFSFGKQKQFYKYDASPAFHCEANGSILTIDTKKGSELTNLVQDYQYKFVEQSTSLDNIREHECTLLNDKLPTYVQPYTDNLKDPKNNPDGNSYITCKVFHKLPDKICIRLNRFASDGSKINDSVSRALNIVIQPDPSHEDITSFDLHGFIVHNGPSASSGHYVAYVKRNGQWYKADDSSVTPVDKSKSIDQSKQAYLLFYKKK